MSDSQSGVYDVVIVGGGPGGLSAAVNLKARNLSCLLLECREPVGSVIWHPEVKNYLGMPKIAGRELADKFSEHFAETGYECMKEKVLKIMLQSNGFMIGTSQNVYESKSVILSVGVTRSKPLPGEEEFLGQGVAYCVTCDGGLYVGEDVIVVGYTPEGEDEANVLAGLAKSVTYIPMYEKIGCLESNVKILWETPTAIEKDGKKMLLKTVKCELAGDGIFVIRDAVPVGTLLDGLKISENCIHVDASMATNIPGIFAAGDCTGMPFQIAKAVGQGQVAALSAAKYVLGTRKET